MSLKSDYMYLRVVPADIISSVYSLLYILLCDNLYHLLFALVCSFPGLHSFLVEVKFLRTVMVKLLIILNV